MALEEFRRIADINWNRLHGRIRPSVIRVKSGDVLGRRIRVTVTDEGVYQDLTGYTLSLAWQHPGNGTSGLDAFTATDITHGVFEIVFTTDMLTNFGNITASLYLAGGGSIYESYSFLITNEQTNLDEEAVQGQSSFSTLENLILQASGGGPLGVLVANLEQSVIAMDRGYGGSYATLAAIEAAFPTGDTKRYVATGTGHWYYWNGSAWTDGGVFQATAMPTGVKTIAEFIALVQAAMSAVELVTNGSNFTATTGWTAFSATQAVSGGLLVITGTGSAYSGSNFYVGAADATGTKYYYRYTMRVRNSGCQKIGIRSSSTAVANTEIANPTIDVWYTKHGGFTKTAAAGTGTNVSPTQYYTNTAGMVLEVAEVNAVNLTALYGAGLEPTPDDFGMLFDTWFVDKFNEIGVMPVGYQTTAEQISLLQGAVEGVNVITNPKDFVAATGWYTFSSTQAAVGGNLVVTGTSGTYCGTDWRFSVGDPTGTKYYYRYTMRVRDAGCTKIGIRSDGSPVANTEILNPVQDQWYTKSGGYTKTDVIGGETNVGLTQYHASVTGKVLEIAEAHIINLTALYGAGLEPDYEEFGTVYESWIATKLKDVTPEVVDLTAYEALQEEVIWTKQKAASMSYAFITDPHIIDTRYTAGIQKLRNAVRIANMGYLDFLCIGGDFMNESGYHEDISVNRGKILAVNEILKESTIPVIVLHGNHDDNSTTEFPHTAAADFSQDDFYKTLINPFIGEGFIHDSQKPTSTYFYKDFPSKKMRLIVLDGCDYPVIIDTGNYRYRGADWFGYGARQTTWLGTEALVGIPTGYRIVVLSHLGIGTSYNNGTLIEGQLSACHAGSTYSGTNANADYGVSVNVDFTSQGARPILSYQCGHNHVDSVTLRAGGWNVVVTDDCMTNEVIDITTVDVAGKTYYTRFGVGSDREITY